MIRDGQVLKCAGNLKFKMCLYRGAGGGIPDPKEIIVANISLGLRENQAESCRFYTIMLNGNVLYLSRQCSCVADHPFI